MSYFFQSWTIDFCHIIHRITITMRLYLGFFSLINIHCWKMYISTSYYWLQIRMYTVVHYTHIIHVYISMYFSEVILKCKLHLQIELYQRCIKGLVLQWVINSNVERVHALAQISSIDSERPNSSTLCLCLFEEKMNWNYKAHI